MKHTTFHWNGATFALSEDTVSVGIDAEYVLYLLFPAPTDRQFRQGLDYGGFLARVTLIDGDPGFTLPSLDDPQAIRDFYPIYKQLPRDFRNAHIGAQTALLVAANAPDLTPGLDGLKKTDPPTVADASSNSEVLTESSLVLPAAVSD